MQEGPSPDDVAAQWQWDYIPVTAQDGGTRNSRLSWCTYSIARRFPNCAQRVAVGYLKIVFFFFNLFVVFFQTATKLLGQTIIKLFGNNYLINRSVRYIFWPRGAVKNC